MMLRPRRPKLPPPPAPIQTLTVPAPIGGLNARDSLSLMPPTDAVTLDNFFPNTTSVDLRKGFRKWSTGYPAAIETLMDYNGPTGGKLFAASDTAFYDATAQGVVGAAVVSGLANARWQYTNAGTPGGSFLVAVNGSDYPQLYDGANWKMYASTSTAQTISSITRVGTLATLTTAAPHGLVTGNWVTISGTTPAGFSGTYRITVTGASTFTYVMAADPGGNATVVGSYVISPAITGVDPRLLIHVNLYASRIFFVEKNSTRVWYLAANAISGAALSLDFAPLMALGGYIMAMATWTIDNADGVNEYAVFLTSEGEVLMYSGTDPSSATAWFKNGIYRIGRPVGRRCFMRMGSDVILLTSDGFIPLSKALLTDRTQEVAISDKITNLVSNDLALYSSNFGWQPLMYPGGNKLLVNVPNVYRSLSGAPASVTASYQYVMNVITGAWCRYKGWNAGCWGSLADNVYFGSNLINGAANSAYVAQAEYGYSDDGGYVFGEAKPAFQYFGNPGYQKHVTMARPIFRVAGELQVTMAMDMDFADNYPVAAPSFSGANGSPWNTSPWDTSAWGSPSQIKKDFQGVAGVGDAGTLHMRAVNNMTSTSWQSVLYGYRLGGLL